MQSGRFLALALLAPLSLPAQQSAAVQLFGSQNNSFPGGITLAGFGLSVGTPSASLRGSFGLSTATLSSSSTSPRPDAGRWSGDLDLLIGTDLLGLSFLLGGLQPYGFIGAGAHSLSTSPTMGDAVKTWGYGGGVAVPLTSSLALQGELRNRSVLGTTTVSSDFVSGREYRIGLSLSLGAGRSSSGSRVSTTRGSSGTIWNTGSNVPAAGAARRVVPRGEQYIGVPYVWGGETPKGFDCSGFVQYVYAREGVELPRTSRQMVGSGTAVDPRPSAMAVGDLLLFADGGPISHVAIYAGNGRILHSSSSGNGVRYDDLSSQRGQWYRQNLVAVRRVATGSAAISAANFAKSLIPFVAYDPPDKAPRVRK